ncbi:MAG: porin family protein [Hyphomicrobium sp.]|nr:porin family protein [Hyphomicrobium sp.]
MSNIAFADGYEAVDQGFMPSPAPSWSGFYVGGHLGGSWADVNWAYETLSKESVSNDSNGFIGGGHIGFQHQFNNFVMGLEASVSGADLSGTMRSRLRPPNPIDSYKTEIDTIVMVAGRFGVTFNQFLPYVRVGYAGADVTTSGKSSIPDSFSIADWKSGWVLGGGLETMLGKNFVAGVEYNYIDLGESNRRGVTVQERDSFTLTDVDTQIQSVTARISYKFGRDRHQPVPLK